MSFEDDLASADLAVTDRLGEPISYTPTGGPTVFPVGIFDAAYHGADAGDRVRVAGFHPAVFFRLADLPVAPELDDPTLVIGSASYKVAEVQPDGIGGVLLLLQKVA